MIIFFNKTITYTPFDRKNGSGLAQKSSILHR
jgi:hypothetical protein